MKQLQDAAAEAGVTYRQAFHWVQKRYILAVWRDRAGEPLEGPAGPGASVCWLDEHEEAILVRMALLTRAGVLPHKARLLARRLAREGTVQLGPNLWLSEATAS